MTAMTAHIGADIHMSAVFRGRSFLAMRGPTAEKNHIAALVAAIPTTSAENPPITPMSH